MILFSLKLFIAHLIGDFLFQPDSWIADKEKLKFRSKFLYAHLLVHASALFILLSFDNKYIWSILIIVSTHYLIDLAKLYSQNAINKRWLFLIDQITHISVLIAIIYYWYPFTIELALLSEAKTLLLIAAILLTTVVAATLMKVIMNQWSLDEDENDHSLPKAGYYIGMLERIFVFTFIVLQQWQAIGFLIAAKSVFRFGDLSKARDRKLTEYILIGTLLSFGIAILIGLAYTSLQPIILIK